MRLKLTVEYDGTGVPRLGRQPGRATVEGELRRALARSTARVDDARGRGSHRHRRARARERRLGRGRRRARRRARGRGAERRAAARPRVLAAEQAPDDVRRALRRARALVPLPGLAAQRAVGRSRRGARSGIRGRWISTRCENAAALLVGAHDFRRSRRARRSTSGSYARSSEARWVELDEDVVAFEITADSFLRHMVRTLVGSMLEGTSSRRCSPAARRAGKTARRTASTRSHGSAPADVSWGLSLEHG